MILFQDTLFHTIHSEERTFFFREQRRAGSPSNIKSGVRLRETMAAPTLTPLANSAHATSMRSTVSSKSPITNKILKQAEVIERIMLKASEGSALAAALPPFLSALRDHLQQDTSLKRIEAKLDKLSADIARPTTDA